MANVAKLAEEIVGLTLMEATELTNVLKDEYGIEAAAAAVAAAPAGGAANDAGGAEEKTDFDIVLESAGGNKIAVIKEVRAITGLGLKEAKDLAEKGGAIKEGVAKDEAEEAKKKLEEAGATVALK